MCEYTNDPEISACDVLVLAEYFCDIILTGLPEPPRLGAEIFGESLEIAPGGAYILTTALHRLGVRVRWMARLGNDLFSQFVQAEAQREGLDTSLFQRFDRPLRSVSVSFSFVHDRGFISYMDSFPDQTLEPIIAAQKPRWVVNAPFDGSPESLRLVDFIHQHGGRVYTDCQYVTTTLAEPGLCDMLSVVDIFAPNLSEARQLTGETEPQRAAARLAEFCQLVIVKCGADGAYAQAGRQTWYSPALKVNVLDTTGAGDSFNAGFLAAQLRGEPIEICLRYGNICGGLSTTQRGGASAAPTLEQLSQYL
jgi:sugar/nucleoside kinase (ribokinase family)